MLGTTSIIPSHERLHFNRRSFKTICYVKAERLNLLLQLHQSRNLQQLNGRNGALSETFLAETRADGSTFSIEYRSLKAEVLKTPAKFFARV